MDDRPHWPEDESRPRPSDARPPWRSLLNLTSPFVLDVEPADRRHDRGWFGDVVLPLLVLFGALALLIVVYKLTSGFGGWLP